MATGCYGWCDTTTCSSWWGKEGVGPQRRGMEAERRRFYFDCWTNRRAGLRKKSCDKHLSLGGQSWWKLSLSPLILGLHHAPTDESSSVTTGEKLMLSLHPQPCVCALASPASAVRAGRTQFAPILESIDRVFTLKFDKYKLQMEREDSVRLSCNPKPRYAWLSCVRLHVVQEKSSRLWSEIEPGSARADRERWHQRTEPLKGQRLPQKPALSENKSGRHKRNTVGYGFDRV